MLLSGTPVVVGGISCAFFSASILAKVSALTLSTPVSAGVAGATVGVGAVTGVGVLIGCTGGVVDTGAVTTGANIGFVILSEKTGAVVCPVVLGGVVVLGLRLLGFDTLVGAFTVTPLFTTPLPQITLDCHGLAASVVCGVLSSLLVVCHKAILN